MERWLDEMNQRHYSLFWLGSRYGHKLRYRGDTLGKIGNTDTGVDESPGH